MVAEEIHISTTQIQSIAKDKEAILKQSTARESLSKKYTNVRKMDMRRYM